jgi:Protein of unknown function (DUF3592)
MTPNPSIERTCFGGLCPPAHAAHVERLGAHSASPRTKMSALPYIPVLVSTECVASIAAGDGEQTLLALVCGGFGMLLLLLVVSALREAAAMKRWPLAKGRVLSSTVEQYKTIAGAGDFGSTRTHMTLYRPSIVYEYEAAGQRFKGDRIAQSPGFNRGVPIFAEKTVQRYPSGSAVDVRFNPKRPSESVLEPRVPAGWIFVLVIAVALLALAGHIYYGPA